MDFPLPQLGEGVYEAELVRWRIKPGDTVKRGQVLLDVLTDKATMEVPAPFSGTIGSLHAEAGKSIKVGDVILVYTPAGASDIIPSSGSQRPESIASAVATQTSPVAVGSNGTSPPPPPANSTSRRATAVAAPSVRHLARHLGIDLTRVTGTGSGGRILVEDLRSHLATTSAEKSPAKAKDQGPPPDYGTPGTRIRMHGLRRKIAEHLVDAMRRIPHYSYIDECDITDLVKLRQSLREPCAARGLKLTYLSFFVKAVTAALKEVPICNSSLDEQSQEIVLHDRYNIGIAVATPSGLVVPVVKNADKKDVFTIAAEIERLGNETKAGRAKLEDLRGGTFTVTSVGNLGGIISTPIINHPEVGIMGVGKVVKRPVYDSYGNLRPADVIYLSFSFDHRVVDGAVCAAFGNAIIKHLQNPSSMLIPDSIK